MPENDLVSVIIPSLNSDRFLDKTLRSILNQTYTNFEIIIVDNNSNDGILMVTSSHNSINNSQAYNNTNGIALYSDSLDNKYYGTLKSFSNKNSDIHLDDYGENTLAA